MGPSSYSSVTNPEDNVRVMTTIDAETPSPRDSSVAVTAGAAVRTMPAGVVDGRHARRHRATEQVVAATVDLFAEGEYFPTAQQIAARAGVSLRSLFRYADSLEKLASVALGSWEEQFPGLRLHAVDPQAPLAVRARRLAAHQSAFWVATAAYRRAVATLRVRTPDAGIVVDGWAALTRSNVAEHLAPELAEFEVLERELRLAAAEVAVQAATTDHLAGPLRIEQPDLAETVALLVEGALRLPPRRG